MKRFRSRAAWETWLTRHHESAPGIWLQIAKKGSGVASVTYAEALEAALCCGWIDGVRAGIDETWFRQRFTPRRPGSKWSQINRATVERLHAEGRLLPRGLREMDAARQDGRWDAAYPSQKDITVPDDLAAWLRTHPRARRHFEGLDSRNRYAILYRLHDAKRPETRERRLQQFTQMLAAGETLYPRPSGG